MHQDLLHHLVDWVRNRHFGKHRGKVVSNEDPTGRGRLKVTVPSVLGELEVWAMPCVPYAGNGVGFYCLPAEKTGVWIEFEAGNLSFPIWSGCFWADDEIPDDNNPEIKTLKTESLMIRLDDAADELKLENTGGSVQSLAADVTTTSGGASHTVGTGEVVSDSGANGKVAVGSGSVSVNSGAFEVA